MKQRLMLIVITALVALMASSAAFAAPAFPWLSSIQGVLEEPSFVAMDSHGNLYVSETSKNRVRIFDINGVYINTLQVERPRALAVDAAGNIYVSVSADKKAMKPGRVEVYSPSLLKTGIVGNALDNVQCEAIAIGADGRIYVVNRAAGSVNVYDSAGNYLPGASIVAAGSAAGQLNKPIGIAIDEARGNVYVLDYPNTYAPNASNLNVNAPRIQIFTKSGSLANPGMVPSPVFSATTVTVQDSWPVAIAVDKSGTLYVSDANRHQVRIFNPQTGVEATALNADMSLLWFSPKGLVIGQDNILRVASTNSVEVYALGGYETMSIGLSSTLSFTAKQLGANPAPQTVSIANSGTGALNWSATKDASLSWLTMNGQPTSTATVTGSTGPKGSGNLTIGVDITGLTSGTYNGKVAIVSDFGQTIMVTVNLTVQAPPILSLSTGGLLSAVKKGQNPAPQPVTVNVLNTDALLWSAGSNTSWLTIFPSSGLTSTIASVQVNANGLGVGAYTGTILFSAPGALGNQSSLTMTLTITSSTMISVATNRPEAGFTVTGPGPTTYTGTGTSWSIENVAAGDYTVTFNAVPGYKRPRPQTKTLAADGTLQFTATYSSWADLAAKKNIIAAKGPWVKNNALIRTFDRTGAPITSASQDLLAMDSFYGANIAIGDIDGDGTAEIIVGSGAGPDNVTLVRIYKAGNKTPLLEFNPFESEGLRGGVNVAVADFAGDGKSEVIVAPAGGAENPALVKVFAYDGVSMVWTGITITAHDTPAGVNIAAADTVGNYIDAPKLITAPAAGTDANPGSVKIWTVDASQPVSKWTATFLSEIPLAGKYGATLAAGDTDGNGKDKIIVGVGADSVMTTEGTDKSQVRIYDGVTEVKRITVFDEKFGVNVAAADLDGDGIVEIIAGIGPDPGIQVSPSTTDDRDERKNKKGRTTKQKPGSTATVTPPLSNVVRIYSATTGTINSTIVPYATDVKYGVKVAAGDLGL